MPRGSRAGVRVIRVSPTSEPIERGGPSSTPSVGTGDALAGICVVAAGVGVIGLNVRGLNVRGVGVRIMAVLGPQVIVEDVEVVVTLVHIMPMDIMVPPEVIMPVEVMVPPEVIMPVEVMIPPEIMVPVEVMVPPEGIVPVEVMVPPEGIVPVEGVVPVEVVPVVEPWVVVLPPMLTTVMELGPGSKLMVKLIPAGICLTLRPVAATAELSPSGKTAAALARPVMFAAPDAEVGEPPLTTTFMETDAGMPARAFASAVRSLRSTLAPTPLRSACTQCVNCWPVGAVWRIDSNCAVTR
jgi:hypothetical protein